MKFRILFGLFNFVVIAAFALVVFLPLTVLGMEYARVFWAGNWPVAVVFVVVLAGLNTYFGINWKLFTLLEHEDWEGLAVHLEERVLRKGRPTRQRIRVLINAYVVSGKAERITGLEKRMREVSPGWITRFPLEFGVPYLLGGDAEAMEGFFGEMKSEPRVAEPLWVRWNYAFALALQKRAEEARGELMAVAAEVKDPVQTVVTAYLLDSVAVDDEAARAESNRLRRALVSRFTGSRWNRELAQNRSGLQQLVLGKLIEQAASWAFDSGEEERA